MKYLKTFENMSMAKSIISKKMEGFEFQNIQKLFRKI
jgi:hypothetical protein